MVYEKNKKHNYYIKPSSYGLDILLQWSIKWDFKHWITLLNADVNWNRAYKNQLVT